MQDVLNHHPSLWRAADLQRASAWRSQGQTGIPTGYVLLDEALPDGGWPREGVMELLSPESGAEADLLAPLLRALGVQQRWQVWINPPWLPYAPALQQHGIEPAKALLLTCGSDQDALWAMEQCLASGSCSIVQAWPSRLQSRQIRRLHLAAQKGTALGVLLRPQACALQPSPAPLRLELKTGQAAFQVRVLKRRGGWGTDWLTLKTFPQSSPPCSAVSAPLPRHRGALEPVAVPDELMALDRIIRITPVHHSHPGWPGA